MGYDASATICFGLSFDEDFEFPWDDDAEDWWIDVIHAYKPPFQLFDGQGRYIDGKTPTQKQIHEYYDHRQAFQEKHPLPAVFVHSGSDELSSPILAVPSSVVKTSWDAPAEIGAHIFASINAEELQKFKEFCMGYLGIVTDPKWYLSAYYG
jgi:hypothetical protein